MTHAVAVPADARARRDHLAIVLIAAAVTAALWQLPAGTGLGGLIAVVAVVQALLVAAWTAAIALPGRVGSIALGVGAAAWADSVAVLADRPSLAPVAGVVGVALLVMFIHQLCRGVVRVRMTASIAGIAVLVVSVAALAALLTVHRRTDGDALAATVVLAGGCSLMIANVVDAIAPIGRFDHDVAAGAVAPALGCVTGGAVALWRLRDVVDVGGRDAVLLGAAVGLVAALLAVGAAFVDATVPPTRDIARRSAVLLLRVTVPICLVAPVGYLLARLVLA